MESGHLLSSSGLDSLQESFRGRPCRFNHASCNVLQFGKSLSLHSVNILNPVALAFKSTGSVFSYFNIFFCYEVYPSSLHFAVLVNFISMAVIVVLSSAFIAQLYTSV